jgi:Flp pilus assembly protein TadG
MRASKLRSAVIARMASWTRLAGDRRGVSAAEFAMIAPALILLYVGLAEIGTAVTVYRRTSSVASTAADLTAQVKTVSTSDLDDIISAASSILTPYSAAPLELVISSVVADQNNNGRVSWSYAKNGTTRGVNTTYVVPPGLTEAGSSVIVAELGYEFTPLVGLTTVFSPGTFEMQRTFYARPRRSLTVTKTN